MSLVIRCPNCKGHNELEEEDLTSSTLNCPLCHVNNPIEEYSVMTFCPHCHQKLAIPADMIYENELYCAKCDRPFNPNTSISLSSSNIDDYETEVTMYSGQEENNQLYHAGDYFDKYQIISLLGKGGMGEVYLAKHLLLNKEVAIKIMLASAAAKNPVTAKRFIREAKIANQINSSNIVKVYDAGLDQKSNQLFISMEYVDGKNLSQLLAANGVFSETDTLKITFEVCNALEEMEKAGIVHRDIKPSNIMVTNSGIVKLADLGIAKANNSQIQEELTLTANNIVFGTPNYASPEQCKSSHHTDTRSDIYSLGATMFCMVTGIAPFNGTNPVDTMFKVIHEEPENLLACAPNLTPDFVKLIYDMIAKDPIKRPQTINDLKNRINDCLDNKKTIAPLKEIPLPKGPTLYKIKDPNNNTVTPNDDWEKNFIEKEDNSTKEENIIITFIKEIYTSYKSIFKYSLLTLKLLVLGILIYFGSAVILSFSTGTPLNVQLEKMGLSQKTQALLADSIDTTKPNKTYNNTSTNYYDKQKQENEKAKKFIEETLAKVGTKKSATEYVLSQEEFQKAYRKIFANVNGNYNTIEGRLSINNQILASDVFKNENLRHDPFIKAIYNHNLEINKHLTKQYNRKKAAIAEKSKYSQAKTDAAIKYIKKISNNFVDNNKNLTFNKFAKDKEIDLSATVEISDRYYVISNRNSDNKNKVYQISEVILANIGSFRNDITKDTLNELSKRNFLPGKDLKFFNDAVLEFGVEDFSGYSKLLYYSHEKLLFNNINLTEVDDKKNTIIFYYTYSKSYDNILKCLYANANLNHQNIEGETPLFWAEKQGPDFLRKLFIHFGADENIKNITSKVAQDYRLNGDILEAIAQKDQDAIIKILKQKPEYKLTISKLSYGNYSNYSHSRYSTKLLSECCTHSFDKVLAYLIDEKVDLFNPENIGNQPLILQAFAAKNTDIQAKKNIYKLLLDNGSDVLFSSANNNGNTTGLWMLHLKSDRTEEEEYLYKELLAHYSNDLYAKSYLKMFFPNRQYYSLWADYFFENRTKFHELTTTLLENGGPIDWNNDEMKKIIPDVLASPYCDVETLKLLKKLNCNLFTLDSNGKDALHNTLTMLSLILKKYQHVFSNSNDKDINQKPYEFFNEQKQKCRYLKSLGMTADQSNFNISSEHWKELFDE